MKFKAFITIMFVFFAFQNGIAAEILTPSAEDKDVLKVYLVMDPENNDPIFIRDIDNNLIFSKNSHSMQQGYISSNACLLINLENLGNSWDYLDYYYEGTDANLYLVDSIYEQYGVKNLAKILANQSEADIKEFAKNSGFNLEVVTTCKNIKSGDKSNLYDQNDMFFIPHYIYSLLLERGSEKLQAVTQDSLLINYSFDEIKTLSDNYLNILEEEIIAKNALQEKFKKLANEKSKDYMGSLYLSTNTQYSDGFETDNQNTKKYQYFCTLNYSGEDAIAVLGYRLKGNQILLNNELIEYHNQQNISIEVYENENYYQNTFDNINDAYLAIKDNINYGYYCNIFVDYPENLLKLKTALERDFDSLFAIGQLYDKENTGNEYAIEMGFDTYDQYLFSISIDGNKKDIDLLKSYQIINQSDFKKIQEEIIGSNYSKDTKIPTVLIYLKDRNEARKQGMNVLDFKNLRVAKDKGYDDYDQYLFSISIDGNKKDIDLLKSYQIINQSDFKTIQEEIIGSNYSKDTKIPTVLIYLKDRNEARKQGMNVLDFKNLRVEEEQRLAKEAREEEQRLAKEAREEEQRLAKEAREQEQKRREEFAKEYPYTATLTCGMSGSDHINIVACFVGGTYGVDTELEVRNGDAYQLYKPYNLNQAGTEYYSGLEINLRENFEIKAQNSSENLILSLEIIENFTGNSVFIKSVGEFGVIRISN
jgi:hypothetical protein